MAVVLSARLMVRYADKYDPDLAAAFEKLERGLPPPLPSTSSGRSTCLSKAPRDERFSEHVRLLTRAWAERRVVTHRLRAGELRGRRRRRDARRSGRTSSSRRSRPTRCTSSAGTRTRGALRTFKIERIRDVALTPRTFEPPDPGRRVGAARRPGTSSPTRRRSRSCSASSPAVAAACRETTWHPTQTRASRGRRLAALAGDRRRARSRSGCGSCRGATTSRSRAGRRCGTTSPPPTGGRCDALRGRPRRLPDRRGRDGAATRSPRSTSSATRSTATSS